MKKSLSLLLAAAMLLSALTACRKEEEPSSSAPASLPPVEYTYQDGEYEVSYVVPALDRTLDYLVLSVEQDKLEILEYGCKEDNSIAGGGEASSEEASSGASSEAANSETASSEAAGSEASSTGSEEPTEHEANAQEQMEKILESFEQAGQDVDAMEPFEGADEHFYRFQRMIRTALRFAEEGDTTPVVLGKYEDGTYRSEMPNYNVYGWKEYVELTVTDGLVESVTFDAESQEDPTLLISEDPELGADGELGSCYAPIAQEFLENGEQLDALTAPTGGERVLTSFEKLAEPLLASMISAGEKEVVAHMYYDGTYTAQFSTFDSYGWKEYVTLEIQDDQITVLEFDAVSQTEGAPNKSEDTETMEQWSSSVGRDVQDLMEELYANFAASNNDVFEVENVAGATAATNNFKLLVGQLLATAATEGDSEEALEVDRVEVQAAS